MRLMDAVSENRRLSRWAALLPRGRDQLGAVHYADAELVPLGDGRLLALTLDTIAEEIRLGLYSCATTAARAAAVAALSDLAAVGADAVGLLLGATLPKSGFDTLQAEVAAGLGDVCRQAGVAVLGGDTNEGPELVLTGVGVGVVPAALALTRVGARPGEWVFASGPLGVGGALAASQLLGLGNPRLQESEFTPALRLAEGRALRGIASSCMDTSDGLFATLDQLTRLNAIAIRVTRPLRELLQPRVDALRQSAGLPAFPLLASAHGEFELVFTIPERHLPVLQARAAELGWSPLLLGRTEPGHGLFVRERPVDGARLRNLLDETGGELRAYLDGLLSFDLESP